MANETLISTVSPEFSDVEKVLFVYTGIRESFRVYYVTEVVIYVITIFTNAITLTLLSCNRRLRILSNLFFGCLAVTDFIQGFFGVAFNALRICWFSRRADLSFVNVEGVMFLLVGWWLSTLFSYCGILLITLERWLFIAHPFLHQRLYTAKKMFGVVGVAVGMCMVGCAVFSTGAARSVNVGISFPLLHTCFSVLIVSTYAHIILISCRQQRSIRAVKNRTANRSANSHRENADNNGNINIHDSGGIRVSGYDLRGDARNRENDKANTTNAPIFTISSQKHSGDDLGGAANNNSLPATTTNAADALTSNTISVTDLGGSSVKAQGASLNNQMTLVGIEKAANEKRKYNFFSGSKDTKNKYKTAVAHNWKAVRMSATVFCMYFCFMSPWVYYEAFASLIYGPRTETNEISQALNTLTCLHFCSNFFVYSFQNRDFRRVLGKYWAIVFGCCFPSLRNKVTDMANVPSGHY
ncbi:hypothetical protein RRG08_037734 [Elysia crispata]|uniref:G-protein coupled receptors family 1 profile domain-containing protein n=1 Tax=Elysia crispata TaxID=231223 RepID=A0AAE1A7K9_9GAST|nr:hypothetical protein RRG08_037734 [Elysia crispata]